jgi:hypothetical protein
LFLPPLISGITVSTKMRNRRPVWTYSLILLFALVGACSVAEPLSSANTEAVPPANAAGPANAESAPKGATIPIEPNGPADTVRVFYKYLREKKFREAIFLTNLRPAIEGLTEAELKEFALDFEAIAGQVPAEIEINGEIVTGDKATVTANFPGTEGNKDEIQKINLRKPGDVWIILSVDEEAEGRIKREGKQYFYNLRIETHHEEAKKMLERISKAELAHSLQNDGAFADMQTLVSSGLLPPDITTSLSTGYDYAINLAADRKQYYATATPATYGKSGKLSFILKLDGKLISRVTSADNRGKPMTK